MAPFAWQSNKAIFFCFTQNSVSEIQFDPSVQSLVLGNKFGGSYGGKIQGRPHWGPLARSEAVRFMPASYTERRVGGLLKRPDRLGPVVWKGRARVIPSPPCWHSEQQGGSGGRNGVALASAKATFASSTLPSSSSPHQPELPTPRNYFGEEGKQHLECCNTLASIRVSPPACTPGPL